MDFIRLRGARTHNLANIDVDLPRGKLICMTGLSGSGKSSLAFDTIYAEGQRRYVESLSAYARQFLSMLEKPDIDHIEGLSPAIAIQQKTTSHNPRSTVGTVTEIHDYLRLLFARAGIPRCPVHAHPLEAQTVSQMVDRVLALPEGTALMLLAPVVDARKGTHLKILRELQAEGFIRARIDGEIVELDQAPELDANTTHSIEAVVDRLKVREGVAQRLAESFETALRLGAGNARVAFMSAPADTAMSFSEHFACPECGYSIEALEPRNFSFNNPAGACPDCDGLGVREFFDPQRVVSQPELSLAGGAVRGWDRRNAYYSLLIQSLAEACDFDPETPFAQLPENVCELILYGSGERELALRTIDARGREITRQAPFEGVLPNMQRRYRETGSEAVREELARYLSVQPCPTCGGQRLNQAARNVFVGEYNIGSISELTIAAAAAFVDELDLAGPQAQIAAPILREIGQRLRFLLDVGLEYLTLSRSADTLSGGEAQRIRLASQIGAGLVGVLYVLDEPSIGLHQRDNARLLGTLRHLRDLGNTVIVVDHDEEAIREADFVLDMGPGAGSEGGRIVASGSPAEIAANPASLTGQYLSGRRRIDVPPTRLMPEPGRMLEIHGASGNNLTGIDAAFPLGLLTCITGVSGSGKSTLINQTLYPWLARELNGASTRPAPMTGGAGLEQLDKVINIDQAPIGRTPRSNPATYTGIFTHLRELFAATPEARARGYSPGRFSFNVKGGRCEACQGDGVKRVEMHFLPDVHVTCDVCGGRRYNRETLEVRYKGLNIHEVLALSVSEALALFDAIPPLARKLQTLIDTGLGYIRLGQAATTLSGGEAQRVKLARELSKRGTGRTLYILDEPTTGLHFHDIEQLLRVLFRLRDEGNTIVIVEHNLDVIKTADWIIDLGPEGGAGGGQVVATGTPESVAAIKNSHTGQYLQPLLAAHKSRASES